MLMKTNTSDVCSGMYMLRTQAAKHLQLSTSGFDVEAEIAAQIASAGRLTEVPVGYRPRLGLQKLSTWKHGLKILSTIVKSARNYNPGVYYKILNKIILILTGSLLGGSLIDGFLIELDNIHSVFIGISALMLSLQSLLMTSAGDVLRRKQMYIG